MSSEDESFVILGSTPTPSMDRYDSCSISGDGAQVVPKAGEQRLADLSTVMQNGINIVPTVANSSTPLIQSFQDDLEGQYSIISYPGSEAPNSSGAANTDDVNAHQHESNYESSMASLSLSNLSRFSLQMSSMSSKDSHAKTVADNGETSKSPPTEGVQATTTNVVATAPRVFQLGETSGNASSPPTEGVQTAINVVATAPRVFQLGETSGYASSASVNPLNGIIHSASMRIGAGGSFKVDPIVQNELVDDANKKVSLHFVRFSCAR